MNAEGKVVRVEQGMDRPARGAGKQIHLCLVEHCLTWLCWVGATQIPLLPLRQDCNGGTTQSWALCQLTKDLL